MKSRRRSPSSIGRCYQAANQDAAARLPPQALDFKPPLLACCPLQRLHVQEHSCGIRPLRACLSVRVARRGLTCEPQPFPAVSVAQYPRIASVAPSESVTPGVGRV